MAEAMMSANVDQYLREEGEVMQTLQVEKNRSKDEAIAALNASQTRAQTTLTTVSVVALLALTSIGWLLYRQIVRPIGEMQAKMTEIAASQDFSHRLPVRRDDEIGKSVIAFNAMIEKIQQSSEQVRQKTADIHAMLHGIPQGILTIEPGGLVHPEFSEHLKTILETEDIAHRPVIELVFAGSGLSADALSQVDAALAACLGEDEMNFEFNAHLLPAEIEKTLASGQKKILDLNWSVMTNGAGEISRILLCLRDVTELRALARSAQAQARELTIIGEILGVQQEKFHEFIEGANGFVAANAALLAEAASAAPAGRAEAVAVMFRNMHTVKGNARTHGLLTLAATVHDIEQTYDDLRQGRLEWDAERLDRELLLAQQALTEYARINETKLGRSGPGRRGNVERFLMVPKIEVQELLRTLEHASAQDQAQALLARVQTAAALVRRLGTERIDEVLAGVIDSLPELARDLGKQAPLVLMRDHGITVHSQIAGMLRNVFVHLYRNALDHGIETAEHRLGVGKPAQGRIELDLELDHEALRLVLQDDGRGLALDRIHERAIAQGLVGRDEALQPEQIAALIFQSGFSTADQVSEVSGRGVGMDAVKAFVEREGGSITLQLLDGGSAGFRRFRTIITLPAKFALRDATPARPEAAHV